MAGMHTPASAQLAAVAAQLKLQAAGALKLELTRALRSAADPLIQDAKSAAIAMLPKKGGLGVRVADSPIKASVRLSGNPSVRIVASQHDAAATNAGYVRHPVFGRDVWVRQSLPKAEDWWVSAMTGRTDQVTASLMAVIEAVDIRLRLGAL